jgi:hypothetical protein
MKWATPEELETKIQAYFDECDATTVKQTFDKDGNITARITKPYTLTGLALFLHTSRESLHEYMNGELLRFQNASTEEEVQCAKRYVDAVKRAKTMCENWTEEHALIGSTNPIFSIFSLKNNHGWTDKTEVEMKHAGTVLVAPVSYARTQALSEPHTTSSVHALEGDIQPTELKAESALE